MNTDIIDIENIIQAIKDTYNYDFNNYAPASLRRRIEKIFQICNLKNSYELINKIKNNADFFEVFLKNISIEVTELFRDPEFWKLIRLEFLQYLFDNENKIKIWFPAITSGEELYSMEILLRESGLSDKAEIFATSISGKCIEQIKTGLFNIKKININESNYNMLESGSELSKYYSINKVNAYWDTSLINNVTFNKQSLFINPPENVHLVMFRNHMIYYNQTLQDKALNIFFNSLVKGGFFIIGVKESLGNFNSDNKYSLLYKSEKIYKKLF